MQWRDTLAGLTCAPAAWRQVVGAEQLEESTRQLAAEFMVTLCEAREKAPGMMRKLPQFVGRLFQSMLAFLLDVEVGSALLTPLCNGMNPVWKGA